MCILEMFLALNGTVYINISRLTWKGIVYPYNLSIDHKKKIQWTLEKGEERTNIMVRLWSRV